MPGKKRYPPNPPSPPEAVEKSRHGEGRSTAHVQGTEKFACQNEAVLSLLLGVDSNFGYARRQILLYPLSFIPSCLRPFAEGRETVGDHSRPADFGGANFSVPWTTGKANFVGE